LNRGKQIFLLHKIAQHYKDIKTFRQCLWKWVWVSRDKIQTHKKQTR
jgi:hypothetical protein